MDTHMIITIDGPSGVGKGTLGRALAAHYGYAYLDTGLLFRYAAYTCIQRGCDLSDEKAVVEALAGFDGQGIPETSVLRTEDVGEAASKIGAFPGVREILIHSVHQFAARHPTGIVVDGRDMGTAVFPQAARKIYLTASPEERARRRVSDLRQRGLPADQTLILADIKARDHRDTTRAIAPLKPALDAFVIDTSDLNATEVLKKSINFIT